MGPGPTSLEMQILRLHPPSANSDTLEVGAQQAVYFLILIFVFYLAVLDLSHHIWDLWHVGNSSPTRNQIQNQTPCIGTVESLPLDHKSRLRNLYFNKLGR